MSTTSKERTGSYAAGGESPQRKKPWWLLLLALALIALVAFLVTRGGGDDADGTASQQEAAEDADGTAGGDEGAGGAGGNPDVQPGKITAGGATVYPLSEGLTVGDYDGQKVVGKGVPVESVVADEGFWVGQSADDRIFVLLTDADAESAPEIQPGDTIDFKGEVVAHGDDFAQRVGVEGNEGAQRLNALAGHVEISQYRLSGE